MTFSAFNLLLDTFYFPFSFTYQSQNSEKINRFLRDGICNTTETSSFRHYVWEIESLVPK